MTHSLTSCLKNLKSVKIILFESIQFQKDNL